MERGKVRMPNQTAYTGAVLRKRETEGTQINRTESSGTTEEAAVMAVEEQPRVIAKSNQ